MTLELPQQPLFAEDSEKSTIPQIPLTNLLVKYNGKTCVESGNVVKRFSITKLPKYLIFCVKRFSKNIFVKEKNPTIINYPIKNLDMSECIF